MPAIYLQEALPFDELATLNQEFPHYEMLTEPPDPATWNQVEILYGNKLSEKELRAAPRLRWIHCPTADTEELCLHEIKKQENHLLLQT